MADICEQSFLRRFISSKRSHKFPVRIHKIGTFTLIVALLGIFINDYDE